jgi:phospholipase C
MVFSRFDLTITNPNGTSGCNRSRSSKVTKVKDDNDYSPHREPFQYYPSTANPTHIRPSSVEAIGKDGDETHHQYDMHDFIDAVNAGNMPAISFLKPPTIQSGTPQNPIRWTSRSSWSTRSTSSNSQSFGIRRRSL